MQVELCKCYLTRIADICSLFLFIDIIFYNILCSNRLRDKEQMFHPQPMDIHCTCNQLTGVCINYVNVYKIKRCNGLKSQHSQNNHIKNFYVVFFSFGQDVYESSSFYKCGEILPFDDIIYKKTTMCGIVA
jgi:hypothetical protein